MPSDRSEEFFQALESRWMLYCFGVCRKQRQHVSKDVVQGTHTMKCLTCGYLEEWHEDVLCADYQI